MNSMRFYNSDGRAVQNFVPIESGKVKLYCCGPTVYNYAHIGNLRAYTHWDILRRSLERFGYEVNHVMNITDVGHLSDDGDEGEDKMIKGARARGMSVEEIAVFFTEAFFRDTDRLNILKPRIVCRATEHIDDMINLIRKLEERGFTYTAGGNVCFDTSRLPDYGRMALLDRQTLLHGARVEVDSAKRNPLDFILWFTKSKFGNQAMTWDSPWGKGYPGWHLECSAMSLKYLGNHIDIHTGGVDHIPVHHTNEIAQSEAFIGTGRWVNYWLHNEFLVLKSDKMSKSDGNFFTLDRLVEEGFHSLDYRYFILGGHYRSQLAFGIEALKGAQASRRSLSRKVSALREESMGADIQKTGYGPVVLERLNRYDEALKDDQNTPRALAEVWGLVKDEDIPVSERLAAVLEMDGVLGLDLLSDEHGSDVPDAELELMLKARAAARDNKDWKTADEIRDKLFQLGWNVIDTGNESKLEKN